MENIPNSKLQMRTLMLCNDIAFLGITRSLLNQLHVTRRMVNTSAAAVAMIQDHEFEVILIDWREIDNLAEFLSAVRHSKLNQECVFVGIVRDLLDLKQAFAAGVHFLIHKPASAMQIERCLRATYCSIVARRRKHHRESVLILASVNTRMQPVGEATVVNLSEGGAKLRTSVQDFIAGVSLSAGDDVNLRFELPGTEQILEIDGRVVWATADACGVRFRLHPGDPASGTAAMAHRVRRTFDLACVRKGSRGLRLRQSPITRD